MIKHTQFWLEDGSVSIFHENVAYLLPLSLILRLSPHFISRCCVVDSTQGCGLSLGDDVLRVSIKNNLQIRGEELDALVAHILHDIHLDEEVSFKHILRLYIITSPRKCNFERVHAIATNLLHKQYLSHPLNLDLNDWKLLYRAKTVAKELGDEKLEKTLTKALYYSYTVHDDIVLETEAVDGNDPSTTTEGEKESIDTVNIVHATDNHISKTDAAITERLMSNLSEHFSPTLFQPPAALHMECTDVYATLWMEKAVQPSFIDNGTANPFFTLRRLIELVWKRETDPAMGERSEPCKECQGHMRNTWEAEALSIWEMMDSWLDL